MNNKLNFCENCNELTEETVCPRCGRSTREPKDGDMCLVAELGGIGKSMFTDALSNNDIEFVAIPIHGGFTQLNKPTGYKIYVRYDSYDRAKDILDVIFGGQVDGAESTDDLASVIDSLVKVVIDRPLGSRHPEHPDIVYGLNYGYIDGVMGGDGEEQDAYIMGVNFPLPRLSEFSGFVVAVIRRKNDVETKWVVAPLYGGIAPHTPKYTKEQIEKAVYFQEKYFDIEIIM